MNRPFSALFAATLLVAGALPSPVLAAEATDEDGPAFHAVTTKRRGYLGVVLVDINDKLRAHYGAPKDAGVLVSDLADGGPAQKGGLAVGDILVTVDGDKAASSSDVRRLVAGKTAGTVVKLGVRRDRKELTLSVTLVERDVPQVMLDGIFAGNCPPGIDPEELRERVERAMKHIDTDKIRHDVERAMRDERVAERLQERVKELEARIEAIQKRIHDRSGGEGGSY
jgi:membrane-associated protease RseP (regulator of RpoE activity)